MPPFVSLLAQSLASYPGATGYGAGPDTSGSPPIEWVGAPAGGSPIWRSSFPTPAASPAGRPGGFPPLTPEQIRRLLAALLGQPTGATIA